VTDASAARFSLRAERKAGELLRTMGRRYSEPQPLNTFLY
jgi:hypothetical protein